MHHYAAGLPLFLLYSKMEHHNYVITIVYIVSRLSKCYISMLVKGLNKDHRTLHLNCRDGL